MRAGDISTVSQSRDFRDITLDHMWSYAFQELHPTARDQRTRESEILDTLLKMLLIGTFKNVSPSNQWVSCLFGLVLYRGSVDMEGL